MRIRTNLTWQVYQWIHTRLMQHHIIPGQRLVFTEVSSATGVSRTPVNNALSLLAHQGYLDFTPNQGYAVHQFSAQEIAGLFELRAILEKGFLGRAIRLLGKNDLAEIQRHKNSYRKALNLPIDRTILLHDMELHTGVFRCLKNSNLLQAYQDVFQKIIICQPSTGLQQGYLLEHAQDHDNLWQALRSKDVEQAKDILRQHHQQTLTIPPTKESPRLLTMPGKQLPRASTLLTSSNQFYGLR